MTEKQKVSIKKINLLISVLIAFAAWIYVIYNYSPMKDVTYRDVPIKFEGEEALAYEGLGISRSDYETIDVTINQKRASFNKIGAADISVIADVSGCVKGGNGISLDITVPEGTTLESVSTNSISVSVAESTSKDVPVLCEYSDAIEDTTEPAYSKISYKYVSLVGTEDRIEKAEYAALQFKLEDVVAREQSYVMNPVVMDKKGQQISHVVVLPSEISVSASTATSKTVDLVLNVKDNSSAKKTYKAASKIVIKGKESLLKNISSVETESIDISEITESCELTLRYKLPDGVNIAKPSICEKLKIKVQ